jgi:hypothetical protein
MLVREASLDGYYIGPVLFEKGCALLPPGNRTSED